MRFSAVKTLTAALLPLAVAWVGPACATGNATTSQPVIRLAQATPAASAAAEDIFWQSIQNSQDPAMFEAYLEQVRKGVFSGTYKPLAEIKITTLKGAAPATPPAPAPEAPPVVTTNPPPAPASEQASGPTDPVALQQIEACDRAAAHPFDKEKPANIPGLELDEIAPGAALRACLTAAAIPNTPRRIYFELARAYQKSGNTRDSALQLGKAADLGHARSLFNYGVTLLTGGKGVSKDYPMARSMLERAMDAGVADAGAVLGDMYITGKGMRRDYGKALELYEQAKAADSVVVYSYLANLYRNGQGVARDRNKACQINQEGASKGDVQSATDIKRLCRFKF